VLCGVGLITLATVALIVVLIGAWLIGFDDFTLDLEDGINAGELLGTNLGLALLIPFAVLMVWALYGVRPRWVSSNRPGVRWHWLLVCVGMAVVVQSLFLVFGTVGALMERDSPVDAAVLGFIVVVLLTTPLQAAGEEYLFRGMLLQALGAARVPLWGCYVVSGLLFALAHLQFDFWLFADRFVLGVAFAYLAVQTGGLEAPIAIHAVKNISVLIPAALLEQTEDALDPSGVTWIPVAIDLGLLAIIIPWVVWASRRRHGPGGSAGGQLEQGPPMQQPAAAPWAGPPPGTTWGGRPPYAPPAPPFAQPGFRPPYPLPGPAPYPQPGQPPYPQPGQPPYPQPGQPPYRQPGQPPPLPPRQSPSSPPDEPPEQPSQQPGSSTP
jgi:membrane protease YdiL (CAAX protease family)